MLLALLLAFPASAQQSSSNAAPAVAEGRTGPIGLKLEVFDKRLDSKEHLFVRLTLSNLSKKDEFLVSDWIYRGGKPVDQEWEQNTKLKVGRNILEVVDARGRRVWPEPYFSRSTPQDLGAPSETETAAEVARLRAQGVKDVDLPRQLDNWLFSQKESKLRERYPAVVLPPGASTRSKGWCELDDIDLKNQKSCPAEGFVELPFFRFPAPGRYRVRAVRDRTPVPALKLPALRWDVRVATSWIEIEVAP